MSRELDLMRFDTAHLPRPYVNWVVRPHHLFTPKQRYVEAVKAGWNVFQFPSEMTQGGDLLSDSGTTAPTLEQFLAKIAGDSAYGTNWGYGQLMDAFEFAFGTFQKDWRIFLFHQCRTAEHALYSHIRKHKLVVPSNGFFDTTRANAEANGIMALDLPDTSQTNFGGNINLEKLEQVLETDDVPFVLMTVTNNTGGGQPVSLENLREAAKLAQQNDTSIFLDACRFAENAWFIKNRERAHQAKSIRNIVLEMFSLCDGFTISLKKDGLANMGGALVIKKDARILKRYPDLLEKLYDHQILTEGHSTYGGIDGANIMMAAEGLHHVVTDEYLDGRIAQVHGFGEYLGSLGVPIVEPFGGHAVYIDTDRFFADTEMRRDDFGGISLTALLLLKGVRLCELGAFAHGKCNPNTGVETLHAPNYVRAAVPRNKYERDDLCYVADCIKELYERRRELPKAVPVYGKEKPLRHFKARFELKYD